MLIKRCDKNAVFPWCLQELTVRFNSQLHVVALGDTIFVNEVQIYVNRTNSFVYGGSYSNLRVRKFAYSEHYKRTKPIGYIKVTQLLQALSNRIFVWLCTSDLGRGVAGSLCNSRAPCQTYTKGDSDVIFSFHIYTSCYLGMTWARPGKFLL